jgi:hypothetical protein
MNIENKGPRDLKGKRAGEIDQADEIGNIQSDSTPRSEGGEDSIENLSPTDSRADEKVIVNEQRESKAVNIPSQTAVNLSEQTGNDEEVI